jgi:hypothetical protein
LTEVTHECSDTEPVMFILQGNILYLEMGNLGPIFVLRSSASRVAWFCFLVYCLLHCSLFKDISLYALWYISNLQQGITVQFFYSRMTVTKGIHVLLQFRMREKANGL